jgi:hypothetical protein
VTIPAAPNPPGPAPASVGVGSGLVISAAKGLVLLDPPIAGEAAFEGEVQVELNNGLPPADTVVDVNGVQLVPVDFPGPRRFWKLDPNGQQPALGPSGFLLITARSGTLVRSLPVPCPRDIEVTVRPAPGESITTAGSLKIDWTEELLQNPNNLFPSDLYAAVKLRGFDATTRVADDVQPSQALLPEKVQTMTLAPPTTAAPGYLADLRWVGEHVTEDSSRAFCARAKRLAYAR